MTEGQVLEELKKISKMERGMKASALLKIKDEIKTNFSTNAEVSARFIHATTNVDDSNFRGAFIRNKIPFDIEDYELKKQDNNSPYKRRGMIIANDLITEVVSSQLLNSISFSSKLMAAGVHPLRFLGEKVRSSKGVALMANELGHRDVLDFCLDNLKKDEKFVLDIIEKNPGDNMKYTEFKTDTRFVANAICRNSSAMYEVHNLEVLNEVLEMFEENDKVNEKTKEMLQNHINDLMRKAAKKESTGVYRDSTYERDTRRDDPPPKVRYAHARHKSSGRSL